MLFINKITYTAALAAAPVVLFGCSSDDDSGTRDGDDDQTGSGDTATVDENGALSTDPASTIALKGLIGDCLYTNYCNANEGDGCTPDGRESIERNTDFITEVFTAVYNEVVDALGGDEEAQTTLNTLLAEWTTDDPVPDAAQAAIDAICAGTLTDSDNWSADQQDTAATIVKQPATDYITAAIKTTLQDNGLSCEDDDVTAALNYVVGELEAIEVGTTDAALRGWAYEEAIPDAVITFLNAYVAMLLAAQ